MRGTYVTDRAQKTRNLVANTLDDVKIGAVGVPFNVGRFVITKQDNGEVTIDAQPALRLVFVGSFATAEMFLNDQLADK